MSYKKAWVKLKNQFYHRNQTIYGINEIRFLIKEIEKKYITKKNRKK